jgi:hypothetical protein
MIVRLLTTGIRSATLRVGKHNTDLRNNIVQKFIIKTTSFCGSLP